MVLKKFFLTLFLSITLLICCLAQDISTRLAPLSPFERLRYVSGYMESSNLVNTPQFDSFFHQVKIFAVQHNDSLLLEKAEYLIKAKPIFKEQNIDSKIELIKQSLETYRKENKPLLTSDCLVAIGQLQFSKGQYALAFENLLEAEEIFKKIGYERVPTIGKYLHDFALDYFFFQNYEKVIAYMKESIKLPKYNENLDIQRYNTLGAAYLKLKQPDSAYFYFNIAYKKARSYKDIFWIGLCAGNIGEALYSKGEYAAALSYFLEDYRININSDFPDVQQNACVNLAKNYLQLGEMTKARYYLLLTQKFLPKSKTSTFGSQQQLELAKLNYYDASYQYYTKLKDYKTALLYANYLHQAEKIRDRKYNALQEEMASGRLALLQSKMILQKKDLIHEKQKRVKNAVIFSLSIIFLLSALLAIFIYKNKQKIHKKNQQLLKSQLEIAEQSLKIAELKLNEFAARIQEKSKMVEEMKGKLKKGLSTENHLLLIQLQQSTILTEEDWLNFKSLFEQAHSGFLHRLKEKYPEISPAETRYLSLAKLHFSTKEMAAALGVSTQSIRTNWYRIRKKLDSPNSLKVEELVADI